MNEYWANVYVCDKRAIVGEENPTRERADVLSRNTGGASYRVHVRPKRALVLPTSVGKRRVVNIIHPAAKKSFT